MTASNIDVRPSPDVTAVPVLTDIVGTDHVPVYKQSFGTTGNSTLVSFDDPLPTNSNFLDIARQLVTGQSVVFTPASNPNVGVSVVDVNDEGGTFSYLTSAQSLELLSADANDTSAGTGARTVAVETLDGSFDTVIQTVTLNGTTPVALTGTHMRVRRIIVLTAGSGELNAGKLTLRVASAGQTMVVALAGNNRSFSSLYTVPDGCTAYLTRFLLTVGKGQDAICKLNFRPENQTFITGAPLNVYQNDLQRDFPVPLAFSEKTDIKFTAISTNTGTNVSVTYDLILITGEVIPGGL